MPERRKKSFADRVLTTSRTRTGKKRGRHKRKKAREYTKAVRTQNTTGRIDYDENHQKVFTPVK